jgi:hypothetical protein
MLRSTHNAAVRCDVEKISINPGFIAHDDEVRCERNAHANAARAPRFFVSIRFARRGEGLLKKFCTKRCKNGSAGAGNDQKRRIGAK